jgi:glycosyltransferase involved in cell wall biosynthesis
VPPSISVVIPVFNAEPYLAECLHSVLGQTVRPAEIVAVNDGSTDGSLQTLHRYAARSGVPFQVISRENRGSSATLNEGIAAATGEFIAFQDADDRWVPEKLAWQLAAFAAAVTLEACFGHTVCFVSPELSAEIRTGIACPTGPQPGFHKQTLLIRRSVLDRVGGFDEQYLVGEFMDWFLRAKVAGLRYALLPEVVTERRLHRSGLASRMEPGPGYAHILKAALDRQRNAS